MKKIYLLSILLITTWSCSKNHYSYLTVDHFKKNGWYEFKEFKYSGELINMKPSGKGTLVYKNGITIEGNFVDGVLHDKKAKFVIPYIGKIVGNVFEGELTSGEIEYNSGDYYRGSIREYKPFGRGLLVSNGNQTIQIGNFNGFLLSDDFGIRYEKSTNNAIIGEFIDGKPNGDILLKRDNGETDLHFYKRGVDITSSKKEKFIEKQILNENQSEQQYLKNLIEEEKEKLRLSDSKSKILAVCQCALVDWSKCKTMNYNPNNTYDLNLDHFLTAQLKYWELEDQYTTYSERNKHSREFKRLIDREERDTEFIIKTCKRVRNQQSYDELGFDISGYEIDKFRDALQSWWDSDHVSATNAYKLSFNSKIESLENELKDLQDRQINRQNSRLTVLEIEFEENQNQIKQKLISEFDNLCQVKPYSCECNYLGLIDCLDKPCSCEI